MHSFLQSSAWQHFQESLDTPTLWHENALYLKRPTFFGPYWITSRCVLPDEMSIPRPDELPIFIRFEPEDKISQENLQRFAREKGYKLVKSTAIQPRQTSIIPLLQSDEDIIKSMKSKHRYNLKIACRSDLKVEVVSTEHPEAITRFLSLLNTTAERQGFRLHTETYYTKLIESLAPQGMAHLFFIKHDNLDLATLLLITYEGTATYLHGGSGKEQANLMAPYLLHMEAMRFAREHGCVEYDLWGTHLYYDEQTASWETYKEHPSSGTSRFKLGFGGNIVNYPGTYDLILRPFWYTLYKIARKLWRRPGAFN